MLHIVFLRASVIESAKLTPGVYGVLSGGAHSSGTFKNFSISSNILTANMWDRSSLYPWVLSFANSASYKPQMYSVSCMEGMIRLDLLIYTYNRALLLKIPIHFWRYLKVHKYITIPSQNEHETRSEISKTS